MRRVKTLWFLSGEGKISKLVFMGEGWVNDCSWKAESSIVDLYVCHSLHLDFLVPILPNRPPPTTPIWWGISFTLSMDHTYSHDFFAFFSWRFKWWGACPSALRGIQSLHPSGLQEQWNTSDCLKLHCDKFIKRCCKGELLCDDKTFSLYLMLRLLNWARTYSTLHLLALERVKQGELLRVQRTF